MARFAVSAVTCRHAEMRTPFNGWFLMNSLRMICSTFIDWLAHSMRFFPRSARSRFLTSQCTCVGVVDILLLLLITARFRLPVQALKTRIHERQWKARPETFPARTLIRSISVARRSPAGKSLTSRRLQRRLAQASFRGQFGCLIRGFPGKVPIVTPKVPVSRRLPINRPAQIERFDDRLGR